MKISTNPKGLFPWLIILFAVSCTAEEAKPPASKDGLPTDPLGEWYEVGYKMASEATPSLRMFNVSDADISQRLTRILETLGADIQSIKITDLKTLQQGWDDAVAGKKQALTFPADQRGSLVPQVLRGFHRFNDSSSVDLADRAAEWKKSVALIRAKGKGHGTGFFIAPGLIVTNHHVVEGAKYIEVEYDENNSIHTCKAEVIAEQEMPDVALLKIEWKGNPSLPIGDSDSCKELQEVVMIGFPEFDQTNATFVRGHISSTKGAPEELADKDFDVLQLNIEAAGGNSGGPIIDLEGRVVAILTSGYVKKIGQVVVEKNRQFTFAQKSNYILPFLKKHAKGKFERRS